MYCCLLVFRHSYHGCAQHRWRTCASARVLQKSFPQTAVAIVGWVCATKGQFPVECPNSAGELRKKRKESSPTVSVFVVMLWKECVRSHHGETKTPPAGSGRPASRMTCRRARANPPPEESPPMTILLGFTGRCEAPAGGWIRYKSAGAWSESTTKTSSDSRLQAASTS